MRVDVSKPKQCGCVTCIHHRTPWMLSTQQEECGCFSCIQHRTSPIFNTRETEPRNVIGSSVTSIPVSSGPVLASTSTSSPAHTSSTFSFGTATPVIASVNSEPAKQSIDSSLVNCGVQKPKDGPVDASPTSTTSAPVQSSSPSVFSVYPFAFSSSGPFAALPKCSLFGSGEPPVTDVFSSGASATSTLGFGIPATCTSSTSSHFDAPSPWGWGSVQAPAQTSATNTSTTFSFPPAQDSGKTASASPSLFARPDVGISPAITKLTPSPFVWGSMQAPSPKIVSPSMLERGYFGRPDVGISPAITTPTLKGSFRFPPPSWPAQGFEKTGVCAPGLPGFGVNYSGSHSNPFGPNPQTTTPVCDDGSSFAAVHTERGSRYPRYAPTPDLDDPRFNGRLISISASNSHQHKSHEELRWEDYKNGDKGARPNAFFSSSTVSPSLFASPSIPTHPQRTTVGTTQANITGLNFSHTIPTAVERPHEPAGVSSPTSGCTACGATSSSSASGYSPPAVTSLPGLFFPTSGSHPMMFGTPNLEAQGTTTSPTLHPYSMMFGTPNPSAQGTSTTPGVQAYPMMFGIQNIAAQGTTPAVQAYPVNGFILLPSSAMYLQ